MRRLLPLLLVPLVAAVALLPAADPPKAKAPGKGTNYAFLVGCAGYDKTELQPIKDDVTVNDVIEFKKALLATGFADDHIVMMHDQRTDLRGRYLPEHAKIVKELDLFLDGLTKDDTVVVVLSGHGVHFKGDKTGHFCPLDAKISTKKNLLPMDGEGGLYPLLEKCKAGRKLLIANACRNDPASSTSLAGGKIELVDDYPETVPQGIAAIFSCDVGQKSYFDPDRKRSLFMLHMTEAWKTGGNLEDVFKATDVNTKADARKTFGEKQFPKVRRRYDGEWTLARTAGVASNPDYDLTGGHRFAHFGTGGAIRAVVWKYDSRADNQEAWVVDPVNGKTLAGPLQPVGRIERAVFSPDGSRVVTAGWDPVVWDAKTGEKVAVCKHGAHVSEAAFSPDGSKVVTASHDKTAAVWDAKTGEKLAGPLKHDAFVYHAMFSPDGARVVTASVDKTAAVWDAKTGEQLTVCKHDANVGYAGFNPDGTKVVTASWDKTAAVWDAKTGEKLAVCKHADEVFHAAFSPDGTKVVTTESWRDKTATVWDAKTGKKLGSATPK